MKISCCRHRFTTRDARFVKSKALGKNFVKCDTRQSVLGKSFISTTSFFECHLSGTRQSLYRRLRHSAKKRRRLGAGAFDSVFAESWPSTTFFKEKYTLPSALQPDTQQIAECSLTWHSVKLFFKIKFFVECHGQALTNAGLQALSKLAPLSSVY